MENAPRKHGEDLRAASKLIVEATQGVTSVVEEMHRIIASGPGVLGRPLERPVRAMTGVVYGSIRTVTGLLGLGIDAALTQLEPLLGASEPGNEREALLAVLNGVLGDYLVETGNPLAIPMTFKTRGPAKPKLLILLHGSSMNDRQWLRDGHDHGAALAAALGFSPVYLHYNTGRHVSENGQNASQLLEELVRGWSVPVEEIVMIGHSMGGLVARSACLSAGACAWRKKLRKLVFLGTPHHGSPVEIGGNWIDTLLGLTAYSAPLAKLGKIRSAGVTDLRFGNVEDQHWQGRDRFARSADARASVALPDGVDCYAVAASRSLVKAPRLRGDGLVPVDSALGRHARAELTLAFPEHNQWIALGTTHLDLLGSREVYARLLEWLADAPTAHGEESG